MITFLRILTGLVLLGLIVLAAIIFMPVRSTPALAALPDDYTPPEGSGEYVMRLADCSACHTAEGGVPFAGGRKIESPLGTIYSTNITPDEETGIGSYSLDEFRAALYDGVRQDGAHLYPAMPYANYRKLSEEDVRALYAFFMEEVEPVSNAGPETALPFPFNQRWGIRTWKWAALGKAGEVSTTGDALYDRGAYLVEAPGHCSACHTPRNLVMGEAGYTAMDGDFLMGGEIDGWTAPALRGPDSAIRNWSAEDLKLYFASGRNNHAGVNGEMQLVVRDSLQFYSDEDLDAVVAYLRALGDPTDGDNAPPVDPPRTIDRLDTAAGGTEAVLTAAEPGMALGPRLYLDNCNACHFVDGRGADQVFPELDGNPLVTAASATGLIDTILNGAEVPSTTVRPYSLRMPGFDHRLSDEEVAELATFLRSAWSNSAPAVTIADVTARREVAEERAAAE
ncbi:cytochrome c [Frigidibacter sp.]|uniref:cytochrome c n=1 Tax=Frigidibacter sp. TaxID=2586418 RepID=UPI0027353AAF|nr:cytochrome c [Frigidibacter sp.]MDP3342522.1 cytochrome c [Frigidibacter sp.]